MSNGSLAIRKKSMDPLYKNQIIGGICASLIVIFACIRIFVLHASPDGIFTNLMSISGTILSLVVLTSAVRIMLAAKKVRNFESVIIEECEDIDRRYGALIEAADTKKIESLDGLTYFIADNVDAVFTPDSEHWGSLNYLEKFAFSPDFSQTKTLYYYVNYANMKARAEEHGDDLETTARLLARDIAVSIQRGFSDILTAHALEVTQEESRAVVTIQISATKTSHDAHRVADLIDYMLFLHFVAT